MSRKRLLDLCCGGGGAGTGYHRAGFEIVGVDINPLAGKYYPFEFHLADALTFSTEGFDAIHASPPCQRYSVAVLDKERHPDLLPPMREKLLVSGLPWVIENVPGAPMRADYLLCGSMFDLPGLIRHRLFETSWHGFSMTPPCRHDFDAVTVIGHGPNSHSPWRSAPSDEWERVKRRAMGIDWPINRDLLGEAIPPAYTEWIGQKLLEHMEVAA